MKTQKQSTIAIRRALISLCCLLALGTLLAQPLIPTHAQAQSPADQTPIQTATDGEVVATDAQGLRFADNAVRRLEFTAAGIRYLPRQESSSDAGRAFEYRLKAVSRGKAADRYAGEPSPTQTVSNGAEVYYYRAPAVTEKYRVLEDGVEQSFVIDEPFASGKGDLMITGQVGGNLESAGADIRSLGGLTFYFDKQPVLSFAPAVVRDAVGAEFVPEMRLQAGELHMVIDEAWLSDKVFPLTVQSTIRTVSPSSAAVISASSNVTLAAVSEDMPVWRAQLRLQTADVSNAGTDDDVSVQLSEPGNQTWPDYGRNDFERNDAFTYDLVLDNVHTLRDISMLRISKTGTNGWCMRSITLYVNGRAIYALDFGSLGRWLDIDPGNDHRSYTVSYLALRAHSLWTSYEQPALPMFFSRQELKSRVESLIGDDLVRYASAFPDDVLHWGALSGSDYVEVNRTNVQAIHVDLDLREIVNDWPDQDVDIDFDLEFSCSGGKMNVAIKNLVTNVNLSRSNATVFLFSYLLDRLPDQIEGSLRNFTYINAGQPACPNLTVLDDGSLSLAFPRVRY